MKTLKLIAVSAIALILATSCSILTGSTATAADETTVANATTGSAAGTALLGLYTQYKQDGKIDLNNINNILNLATLASNVKGIKNTVDTSSFVSGLINGSKNLVSKANSAKVLESLTTLSGLNLNNISKAADKASQSASDALSSLNTTASSVSTAVSTLSTLFNTLKK